MNGRTRPHLLRSERGTARKGLVLAVVLVVAVVMVAAVLFTRGRQGSRPVREGDQAPVFSLPSTDQRTVSLDGLRGKVVLVHFWATWCPPCVEEMPKLQKLYSEYSGKGLEILAISVDGGGADTVKGFMGKLTLTFPALLDPDQAVAGRYGTSKFPETYVVDRQGTVRFKIIGGIDWTDPGTMTAIGRLVAEH